MKKLKQFILDQLDNKLITPVEAAGMLNELKGKTEVNTKDIAVIGVACKVPMAENKDEFWDNLINGRICMVNKPEEKLLLEKIFKNEHYAEFVGSPQYIEQLENLESYIGPFITDFDKFDAGFFGIPPREAAYIDPTQRIFMETAWAAIEDAGYSVDNIRNTKTGIFVGKDETNRLNYEYITEEDAMKLTGTWEGILASRLNYIYNLKGPSMVIDTACSSGLVSVHEACKSIFNGECEMAVAGGVALGAGPSSCFEEIDKTKDKKKEDSANVMNAVASNDGKVRAFDKKCSGSVFGEGVVTFLLKPLDAAKRDHDHIYAVIKGSAINSDGASNGLTAPNPLAQKEVILEAWKKAKVNPETISYVESHGTATLLGDPIEIIGLTNAFSEFTERKQFCGIGSLKTNVGHLVGASGVANMLKVIMSMQHHMLPASLNFEEPNPHINFVNSPVYVVSNPKEWRDDTHPLRAGVNSFGFSGTNCHVVLEEYKEDKHDYETHKNIFTLSAKTETAMKNLVARYVTYLENVTELNMNDVCYTANTGRGHYDYRLAILVDDFTDFKDKISFLAQNGLQNGKDIYYSRNHIVSDKRQQKAADEISESELLVISAKVQEILLTNQAEHMIWNDEESMQAICRYYVQGADVNWGSLYDGKDTYRVSLPTYAFDRTHYWGIDKVTKIKETDNKTESKHALVKKCLADSIKSSIYLATIDLSRDWVVQDHKIMGSNLAPGTCYAELTNECMQQCYGEGQVEIESMAFLSPLTLTEEDGELEVHIILDKENDYTAITIASKHLDEANHVTWVEHAKGKARMHDEKAPTQARLSEVLATEGIKKLNLVLKPEDNVMQHFGARWGCVQGIYQLEDESIITEVKMLDSIKGDLNEFHLHPGMLDSALNMATIQLYSSGEFYLPFSYKAFKVYRDIPEHFYSRIKNIPDDKLTDIYKFHIELIDDEGNTIVTIEEATLKKINKINNYINSSFYKMVWKESASTSVQGEKPTGNILVFKDQNEYYKELEQGVSSSQNTLYFVDFGTEYKKIDQYHYVVGPFEDDYNQLLKDIDEKEISTVYHMGTFNPLITEYSYEQLEEQLNRGLYSLLFLTKAFQNHVKGKVEFVLISDNAHDVDSNEKYLKPANTSFLSLAKTTCEECQNYTYKSIDLDSKTDFSIVLAEAMTEPELTERVAFRNGVRYQEELTMLELNLDEESSLKVKANGTYVITGGTGGLGLEAAQYLAELNKNSNICLIGRRTMPPREDWDRILEENSDSRSCQLIQAIKSIEKMGSNVLLLTAEVSDYQQLKEAIETVKDKFGSINGVLHCAGVAGDGFLYTKDLETFNRVVKPKIFGATYIDELTRDQDLDFFVFYSSMQTLFGGPGQGDYTAGNAFMDTYAPYLRKGGKKAQTINWPGWSETGMAVEYNVAQYETVFKSLPTQIGINALNSILFNGLSNVVPGQMNYSVVAKAGVENFPFGFSKKILKNVSLYQSDSGEGVKEENVIKIKPEDVVIVGKSDGYTETEKKVAYIYALVLNITEIDIYENFNSMGGDSILAMQLQKALDSQYPSVVEISDIFMLPTVEELAAFIDKQLNGESDLTAQEEEEYIGDNQKEEEIMSILEQLDDGETSVDEAFNKLGLGGSKENE